MRITSAEQMHADGGWRVFSFLKLTTDSELVGWSEYSETSWSPGLSGVIRALTATVIGQDPCAFAKVSAELRASVRMAPGGLADQAIAAIENACIDIAAKAAGVPVCALFGGPYRDTLRLYWSHCGSFRATHAELFEKVLGATPLRTLDDVQKLAGEAAARGYTALKTNPIDFTGERPRLLNPGFRPGLDFARNGEAAVRQQLVQQIAALRNGAGSGVDLMLDVNFGFRPEALRQLVRELEPPGLLWLETDLHEPAALADLRRVARVPIASLESIYGATNYRLYLQAAAVDVAIVDVIWNGLLESLRIAAVADSFEVNVAPHNFYGHLASMISAHFCAAIPNFRIMEYEADDVPWKDELFTHAPEIRQGALVLPKRPGWGTDVNEAAVRAHPPKTR